ncbi:hypothetical protein GAYE_SCF03G2313 [Galdieria yellowstonensis]|uniref:N-formylglutamate deformylase n=1 Tax=Galdieria yellowstonensis TaxID=3028027 RepID=A0AAV9IAL7_9RHOD|nr:hypothetical protein GAYE_SCF03G2313 [Galdieria yellowstonensis]
MSHLEQVEERDQIFPNSIFRAKGHDQNLQVARGKHLSSEKREVETSFTGKSSELSRSAPVSDGFHFHPVKSVSPKNYTTTFTEVAVGTDDKLPVYEVYYPHVSRKAPVVLDSPHSGRYYPADFGSAAPISKLRWGEDAYVDELILGGVESGAIVLYALFPRCYIDVNRFPNDIDMELVDGEWPEALAVSEKTKKGLGLLRKYVVPGVRVYQRKLSVAEVQFRLEHYYKAYHRELQRQLETTFQEFGTVFHIDFHSMKSKGNKMTPDMDGSRRPDMVVGNLRGKSAGPEFTAVVVDTLQDLGYRVSLNEPYAGAAILRMYGNPRQGRHSIQIEINRELYLDEKRVRKIPGKFERLRDDLSILFRRVCAWANAHRSPHSNQPGIRRVLSSDDISLFDDGGGFCDDSDTDWEKTPEQEDSESQLEEDGLEMD